MAGVYQGEPTLLTPILKPVENMTYRSLGVRPDDEMGWKTYAGAMLIFSFIGFVVVFTLQRLQSILPLNPQGLGMWRLTWLSTQLPAL